MGIIKKFFRYFLIAVILLVLFPLVRISKAPSKYPSFLVSKPSVSDKYACKYAIQVVDDSMAPIISEDSCRYRSLLSSQVLADTSFIID